MRRAVLTLGGTVAGLAALFSYKTHAPGVTVAAQPSGPAPVAATAPPTATGSGAASAPMPTASAKASSSATASASAKAPASGTAPAGGSSAPQTVEGPEVNTQYGPVQVTLTVSDQKITALKEVQPPVDSIYAGALPTLTSEALKAQSAKIQAVSGATQTSEGYIGSLQEAIDKAGL